MRGVTYRLWFNDSPHWAVGSTIGSLRQRKAVYWQTAAEGENKTQLYQLIRQGGPDGFGLTEVEAIYFTDYNKLLRAEQELLKDHRDEYCLNVPSAPGTGVQETATGPAGYEAVEPSELSKHQGRMVRAAPPASLVGKTKYVGGILVGVDLEHGLVRYKSLLDRRVYNLRVDGRTFWVRFQHTKRKGL